MRSWAVLIGSLVLSAVFCWQPASAVNQHVDIQNRAFVPQSVTINGGESVTWDNLDSETHSVTADGCPDNCPFNQDLSHNSGFSTTIDKAGSYGYHCRFHPSMTGTINVIGDAPTTAPPPTQPPATEAPSTATTLRTATTRSSSSATSSTTATTTATGAISSATSSSTTSTTSRTSTTEGEFALPTDSSSSGFRPLVFALVMGGLALAGAGYYLYRRRLRSPY